MGCNSKEEYDFFKELHICVRCKKERAEPNKVMCWECCERDKKYDKKKREKKLEEYKKKDKEKYQELKENGICTYCKHEKDNEIEQYQRLTKITKNRLFGRLELKGFVLDYDFKSKRIYGAKDDVNREYSWNKTNDGFYPTDELPF